jgi:hypothetical protein
MPVQCPHCSKVFPGPKLNARHLSICNPESKSVVEPCLCGHTANSATSMKRHRQTCDVWQSRDKNAVCRDRAVKTNIKRYGTAAPIENPEIRARIEATNRERYGAANPFSREASTFDAVQASLNGKRPVLRGSDNPFSREDVKAKIRSTMLEKHGAENPQQVPEIRAKTRDTVIDRYGGELLASPVLREKAEATNIARYGAAFAGGTPDVQAKVRATNIERYGVPYTCMDPEIRRKQIETMHTNYGSHYFASDEGKAEILRVIREKYGADHWMQTPGAWDKLKEVFLQKHGVEHPLQLEGFREKQRQTLIGRYDNPFPGLRNKGPNGLESKILELAGGSLVFTGDGSFWKKLPALNKYKNADFILPGPSPEHPKRNVTKVVEAFGDFWHSRIFTGKAPFDHEQELIDAYADIGIQCLVVWESEVRTDPEAVKSRIQAFLDVRGGSDADDVFSMFR